jgi:hypothetical protein
MPLFGFAAVRFESSGESPAGAADRPWTTVVRRNPPRETLQNPQIKKTRFFPCIRKFVSYVCFTDAQSVSPGLGLKRCASSSNRQTRRKAGTQSHGSSGFLDTRGIARLPKG